MTSLKQQFVLQNFSNDYQLVDGEAMHATHGNQFQIPPSVVKRHVGTGHFVEVRIDSPRFSVHDDDVEQCTCPSCHGEMSDPILRHDHPASLVSITPQKIPSRGWGEDFWVRITEREDDCLKGVVDNPLIETRLHDIHSGDEIILQEKHVLAVHTSHRADLVRRMSAEELKELAVWLGSIKD
ncbi:MAG: hypothetical protein MK102_13575 [Fuerstiella sp.]|nr:hypothetical protein [Fuerstiella sp.]